MLSVRKDTNLPLNEVHRFTFKVTYHDRESDDGFYDTLRSQEFYTTDIKQFNKLVRYENMSYGSFANLKLLAYDQPIFVKILKQIPSKISNKWQEKYLVYIECGFIKEYAASFYKSVAMEVCAANFMKAAEKHLNWKIPAFSISEDLLIRHKVFTLIEQHAKKYKTRLAYKVEKIGNQYACIYSIGDKYVTATHPKKSAAMLRAAVRCFEIQRKCNFFPMKVRTGGQISKLKRRLHKSFIYRPHRPSKKAINRRNWIMRSKFLNLEF